MHLDNGLSFSEQEGLTAHLGACMGCALEYQKLRRTVALVRGLPEVAPPPTFVQEVLRAAREAERTPVPEIRPSLWERIRDAVWISGWEPSPRLAVAALAILVLGVGVGVGGGLLIFHKPVAPAPATATAYPSPTAPSAPAYPAASRSTTQPASGPFEDLVQQMVRRLETSSPATAEDSASAPTLDWGSARIAGPAGQPVDASPLPRRDRQNGSRVYIDF
jgi:anti-sigma factor RsiW